MEIIINRAQIHQRVKRIWSLIRKAQVRKAKVTSEVLVQHLQRLDEERPNEHDVLQALMHAHHSAGYAAALSTRQYDALVPASYFEEMERIARLLQDDVQMVIACAYRGEMYRRYGDLKQALDCLQIAYHTPIKDTAAHGHSAQLLGRMYAQQGEHEQALRLMKEALQFALPDDAFQNSLHGYYCLGAVYLDYAQYHSKMGNVQKALAFHARARATLPDTLHWTTMLTAIQGLMLVEGGKMEEGMPVVVKAVALTKQQGNYSLLDHFYTLQRSLGKQTLEYNRASILLGEAL